jgi:hypothetical protein
MDMSDIIKHYKDAIKKSQDKLEVVEDFQKLIDGKQFINELLVRNNQALQNEYHNKEGKLLKEIEDLKRKLETEQNSSEMPFRLNAIIDKLKAEITVLKTCAVPTGHLVVSEQTFQEYKDLKGNKQANLLNSIISECKEDIAKLHQMLIAKERNIEFLKCVNRNNRAMTYPEYDAMVAKNQTVLDENTRLKKQIEDIRKVFPVMESEELETFG